MKNPVCKTISIDGNEYVLKSAIVAPTAVEFSGVKGAGDLVGRNVFIRTVTNYTVGHVVAVTSDGFFVMSGASWVASTGRFGDAITKGTLSETEFIGETLVAQTAIVDLFPWLHELPTHTK